MTTKLAYIEFANAANLYLTSARGRFWVNEDNDFGYECYWSEFLLKYEEKLENRLFDKPFAYFRDCLSPLMKMKDGEWKAEYAIKYLAELREKYLAEFSDYFEHTSHVASVECLQRWICQKIANLWKE